MQNDDRQVAAVNATRALRPRVFFLFDDGPGWALTKEHGMLPSRAEAFWLMNAAAQFLKKFSDTAIKEHNDAIYREYFPDNRPQGKRLRAAPKKTRIQGFVYLMRHARNGYHKIGFSRNPTARERTLQAEDPELSLVLKLPASLETEQRLHEKFAAVRVRGEWFRLSSEDVRRIPAIIEILEEAS